MTAIKLYYLHISKSGGTSAYRFCKDNDLRFKESVANGNWMNGKHRVEFWNFTLPEQIDIFGDIDIVFNENQLGEYFYPDQVSYIVCIRNPYDVLVSILQNNYHFHHMRTGESITFSEYIRNQFDSPFFRNNLLRYFYNRECEDVELLKKYAYERINDFHIILFENMEKDFPQIFSKLCEKDFSEFPHLHKRHGGRTIRFEELEEDIKDKLTELNREDLEFYQYILDNYDSETKMLNK